MAKSAVKTPPITPNGIDQYWEMMRSGADFFLVKTRKPLNAANAPKVISKGSGGAFSSKVIPITIPIKLKGKSQVSGLIHLDRGYEHLEEKFKSLGASIKRIDSEESMLGAEDLVNV